MNRDLVHAQVFYANYCEMWRAVGALHGPGHVFDVEDRSDALLIRSQLYGRIPHMILDPLVDGHAVQAWVAYLLQGHTPRPATIMVAIPPGEEHSPLIAALRSEGFSAAVRPQVAMTCPIDALHNQPVDDPRIAVVRTEGELEEACHLLGHVFTIPPEVFAFYSPLELVTTYVLREHGMLVAALCLCPFAGSAGIYSVAVVPAQRGRGLARLLVRQALSDAARRGLTLAVLSCDRSLTQLYQNLGFAPVWELAAYWLDAWWV